MTIPRNIDLFNRFSLATFSKLYLSFPVAITINVHDLAISALPTDTNVDEIYDALTIGSEAIAFLAAEGFLTHQGFLPSGHEVMQVRLTMRGLAVLGSTPTSLERKESLITKILGIAGKGLKDAASDQVSELTNQAFALALASAPTIAAAILPS